MIDLTLLSFWELVRLDFTVSGEVFSRVWPYLLLGIMCAGIGAFLVLEVFARMFKK